MTETEWLSSVNPGDLYGELSSRVRGGIGPTRWPFSARLHRLFDCALARQSRYITARVVRRIEVAERFADGRATRGELLAGRPPNHPLNVQDSIGWVVTLDPLDDRGRTGAYIDGVDRSWTAGLIREFVGNPFRPVARDPTWLTEAVVALAAGVYADRAFERLPVLADALEDAGCADADVLAHCRGPGPHARGCWVVDLLLGKA